MSLFPITVDPIFRCWLWDGHLDRRDGRALLWRGRTPVPAYRVVYEHVVGPVPPGLVLAHDCGNPRCVAPHHLSPSTKSENEKQKSPRHRFKRKACKQGHSLALNKQVTLRGLVCRQCGLDAKAPP